MDRVGGEEVGDPVGPFDGGDVGVVEIFVKAEAEEVGGVFKAVEIEVGESVVEVEEDKGGAEDRFGNAEAEGKALDERGLAGAKWAREREDSAWGELGCEFLAESEGLFERI